MNKNDVVKITKIVVRKAFFHYFFDKPRVIDTKQLPLDIFFPDERKVSSLILGLSTSLGTKLWEELAVSLAKKNGFTILDPKELMQPSPIPKKISEIIDRYTSLRDERMNNNPVVLATEYVPKICNLTKNVRPSYKYKKITKGDGADILIRKNNKEYAFDIKTVQINAGSGLKFNKTLLKWYAYRYHQQNSIINNYSFQAKIVFPYNPHINNTWWIKEGGKAKPLDKKDIYVEDEFWKFITGLNKGVAWKAIQKAFNDLHKENFDDLYRKVFQLDGRVFRAVLFADRIGCNLVSITSNANIKRFSNLRNKLTWECCGCNSRFKASISDIKNAVRRSNICSNCEKVFMHDISDLY